MKKLLLTIIFLLTIVNLSFAESAFIQKVEISPLQGGVSFNTVTTDGTSWVTLPTVAMRGRKELMIFNTSTTDNLSLTDVSGSTAIGTLYPRERVTFKLSSTSSIIVSGNAVALNIYASANSVVQVQCWEIR